MIYSTDMVCLTDIIVNTLHKGNTTTTTTTNNNNNNNNAIVILNRRVFMKFVTGILYRNLWTFVEVTLY